MVRFTFPFLLSESQTNNVQLADGIGLACGVLEYLLSLENAPKVIAATHFHEIFENGFLEPRPRLQLGHMEVQVCEGSQDVENQITYLYKSGPKKHFQNDEGLKLIFFLSFIAFDSFRIGRSNKSFGTMYAATTNIQIKALEF